MNQLARRIVPSLALAAWLAACTVPAAGPGLPIASPATSTPSASPSPTPTPSPTMSASASPAASPVTSPSATPTMAAAASAATSPAAATRSFKSDVVPILRAHCAKCHVTGGVGPFAMFDRDGNPVYANVQVRGRSLVSVIENKFMPLDAPGSVSDAEIATLKAWLDAGAPDN